MYCQRCLALGRICTPVHHLLVTIPRISKATSHDVNKRACSVQQLQISTRHATLCHAMHTCMQPCQPWLGRRRLTNEESNLASLGHRATIHLPSRAAGTTVDTRPSQARARHIRAPLPLLLQIQTYVICLLQHQTNLTSRPIRQCADFLNAPKLMRKDVYAHTSDCQTYPIVDRLFLAQWAVTIIALAMLVPPGHASAAPHFPGEYKGKSPLFTSDLPREWDRTTIQSV